MFSTTISDITPALLRPAVLPAPSPSPSPTRGRLDLCELEFPLMRGGVSGAFSRMENALLLLFLVFFFGGIFRNFSVRLLLSLNLCCFNFTGYFSFASIFVPVCVCVCVSLLYNNNEIDISKSKMLLFFFCCCCAL